MPMVRLINSRFFEKWSRDMAYILGFMFADGNIVKTKRGTHFIAIYTADYDLLVAIRNKLQSNHKISKRTSRSGGVYRIQWGNKNLFFRLGKLGLTPNKAKRMRLPLIPRKYVGDFVRGYFDGDGNVWKGLMHKKRKIPKLALLVGFTSASKCFLNDLHALLKIYGIKGGSVYTSKKKNFSRLLLSTNDSLKLYNIMYNTKNALCLSRKKSVFQKFLTSV